MSEISKRGRGRPVAGATKNASVNIRMSFVERAHLNYLANVLGVKSRSEIVRIAVERLYEEESNKR